MESSLAIEHRGIVGGQEIQEGPVDEVRSPWSGDVLHAIVGGGEGDMERAMAAAVEGHRVTSRLPPHERVAILERVAAAIEKHRAELERSIVDEAGKPIRLARGEVSRAISTFKSAAVEVQKGFDSTVPISAVEAGAGRTGVVRRFPRGPVAAITPFNFPLNLVAHKLAPAIGSGCSFILKPAPQTPSAALILGRLIVEAGYPAEAVSVLPCSNEVAQLMVEDERMRTLSFTGSEVGWRLKALAGSKRVLLEMGGNAAAIVEADADLESAARRLAVGAFAYAGQVCVSVQRIFVADEIYDRFAELFKRVVEAEVKYGDPNDEEVLVGPMIDKRALGRVLSWVGQAAAGGAEVHSIGGATERLLPPMIIEGARKGLEVVEEELFGPVVLLERSASLEEAVAEINRGRFGLQSGIFTNDVRKLQYAWRELEVGAVMHNDYPTFRVDQMPYGGVKASGFGREGLRDAMEAYTEQRMLVLREA